MGFGPIIPCGNSRIAKRYVRPIDRGVTVGSVVAPQQEGCDMPKPPQFQAHTMRKCRICGALFHPAGTIARRISHETWCGRSAIGDTVPFPQALSAARLNRNG